MCVSEAFVAAWCAIIGFVWCFPGWWFDWQVTCDVWLMVWLTGDWGAEVVSVAYVLSTRQSPGALWVCRTYARQSSLRGWHRLKIFLAKTHASVMKRERWSAVVTVSAKAVTTFLVATCLHVHCIGDLLTYSYVQYKIWWTNFDERPHRRSCRVSH